jgi:hypothetical protein
MKAGEQRRSVCGRFLIINGLQGFMLVDRDARSRRETCRRYASLALAEMFAQRKVRGYNLAWR